MILTMALARTANMTGEHFDVALQTTAFCSLLLYIKVLLSNIVEGGAKMKAGARPPEDTYQHIPSTEEEKENAMKSVDRARRIINNDMENIPVPLVIAWGSMLCLFLNDKSEANIAHAVLMIVFTATRICHTVVYMMALSYPRALFWALALLAALGMAINCIVASISAFN